MLEDILLKSSKMDKIAAKLLVFYLFYFKSARILMFPGGNSICGENKL